MNSLIFLISSINQTRMSKIRLKEYFLYDQLRFLHRATALFSGRDLKLREIRGVSISPISSIGVSISPRRRQARARARGGTPPPLPPYPSFESGASKRSGAERSGAERRPEARRSDDPPRACLSTRGVRQLRTCRSP